MEEYDTIEGTEPSGVYVDITDYLNSKFNYPNSGQDPIKITDPATGFDRWLQDHFRE